MRRRPCADRRGPASPPGCLRAWDCRERSTLAQWLAGVPNLGFGFLREESLGVAISTAEQPPSDLFGLEQHAADLAT